MMPLKDKTLSDDNTSHAVPSEMTSTKFVGILLSKASALNFLTVIKQFESRTT